MKSKLLFLLFFSLIFSLFFVEFVSAHCPLCTIGAGAAAAGAVWLGVQKVAVAVLIGGFAMSMGMWFARIIKKKYFKYQDLTVVIGVFLLTVLPILPIIGQTTGFYLSLFGNYGSLFNRTYVLNLSLFSSLLGGVIVYFSPLLSKKVTKLRRNKIIPFQGIILTIFLLIIVSTIVHFVV